jgi:putative transposase
VSALRKYDQEFRDRAVGMYRDRLGEAGESKLGVRRQVGALLDVNPATLRNWVEDAERADGGRASSPRPSEPDEVRVLKKRVAELERANEILKTSAAFSLRRSSTADSNDRGLHRLAPRVVRRRADLCRAGRGRDPDRAVHLLRPHDRPVDRRRVGRRPYLANELVTLWRDNWRVYGVRKMWHAARCAGLDVGRDQVSRLMRLAGIAGTVRGKHRTVTTRSDRSAPRHPDLVKRAWQAPTGTDQLWVADFSYVWTLAGFVYVAFVVDVFSRRILGWRVTTSKHTSLVTDALHQALQLRRRSKVDWSATGLIHHSDAGSQGGFNWSSQHLDRGGVDGQAGGLDGGVDGQVGDEVAGEAVASAGGRAGVLARDRQRSHQRAGSSSGGCVTGGRDPVVPRAWRYASDRSRTTVWPVSVVP